MWIEEGAGSGGLAKIIKFSEAEGHYSMQCCDSSGCPIDDEECKYKYLIYPFGGIKNRDKILKALRADLDDIDHSKLLKNVMDYDFCKYSEFIKQLAELLFSTTIQELNLPSPKQKQLVKEICQRILINLCERFFQE